MLIRRIGVVALQGICKKPISSIFSSRSIKRNSSCNHFRSVNYEAAGGISVLWQALRPRENAVGSYHRGGVRRREKWRINNGHLEIALDIQTAMRKSFCMTPISASSANALRSAAVSMSRAIS